MQHSEVENLINFGKLVKKLRKQKSSSLNRIAFQRGGVTSATLSRIENAQVDFKFSTLIRLAHTLDIPLTDLFKDYKYKTDFDN
ncbi:helix-turn-helix transcriptional regulator [bacterium]|nr:helix-turn-helix transcriptional regulator [bacterium]